MRNEASRSVTDIQTFGLAAVAAELKLPMDQLEPEVARAVEHGAAALYFAGYSARGLRRRRVAAAPLRTSARSH